MARTALLLAVALAGFAGFQWATWPEVAALAQADPETTAFIERYRARQREAGRSDRVAWTQVPARRIAPALKIAVLVAEDIDFFSHRGFATGELRVALAEAWEEKELPRGASTITQQLAKNLWLSPSRNPWRKVKEALLTRQLERTLGKPRILELYLNVVELGPGLYGAEAASRRYFGKGASALSDREAAALAAALPKPSAWHPGSESRAYRRRVETVLRRMERAKGWLGPLVR
ncbi:MAG: monofunctional biosynthetic peptidoglycan transglycosylase [Thermoanaerobaculia bacterium]|nr:monofunctional biosynthetic peptidoglycan transglycosylase [Thermoanaerobaculia bacterium]MCZ7650422.1 monofunctional biosynthetic peptidoglycan transglycosylase [Thermoanaerobaculia bacterium]